MAILHSLGGNLVDSKEVKAKESSGALTRFDNSTKKKKNAKISFRSGTLTSRDLDDDGAVAFTPIGIGRPLSMEIVTIYSGDAPKKFLGGKPDLLVTSGAKYIHVHEAQPKAVNQLITNIEKRTYYEPEAFTKGCPIIYYSPAVGAETILCSVELVANSFDKKGVKQLSNLLSAAAGTPIFAPSSSLIMTGSAVINIAGKIGDAIFESKPFLKDSIQIRFNTPTMQRSTARIYVVCNDKHSAELEAYRTIVKSSSLGGDKIVLEDKQTGKEYRGKAPYMVVVIDGKEKPLLEDFQPQLASAALLNKFYGSDPQKVGTKLIKEALQLYNDHHFHQEANELKAKLKKMEPGSETFELELARFKAFQKNIRNKKFKVTSRGIPKKKKS